MLQSNFSESVDKWTEWANETKCFDIALLKIWVQFENFVSDLFVNYSIGVSSERSYFPERKLEFENEEHLNAFLKEGNKKYIEYFDKISNLSKHIFVDNPFDVMLATDYYNIVEQIKTIRNYVAHESNEAKSKFINKCLSGNGNKFTNINDFLLSKNKSENCSYFSFYITKLLELSELLIEKNIV